MRVSRREVLKDAAAAAAAISAMPAATRGEAVKEFPVTGEFVVDQYEVCLNNARWHPMSRGAKNAVVDYLDYKMRGMWTPTPSLESPESIAVRKSFAELIGAKPAEVAFVNSTTAART